MIQYIKHLIQRKKSGELMMDYILPDAYEWLEAEMLIKDEAWMSFWADACKYELSMRSKLNVTLYKSLERVKIHDIQKHSEFLKRYRKRIAKKMAVYEFIQSLEDITEKPKLSVTKTIINKQTLNT